MVIGFLGKGGSGKSTLSHRFIEDMLSQGRNILAIDADHNMDLTYNLDTARDDKFLGSAMPDILRYCGLNPNDQKNKYQDVFKLPEQPKFQLDPADEFTEKYAPLIRSKLRLMVSGPHTNEVLAGQKCSHSLSTPLKLYLPFLTIKENELVVVDEKAGADGAGTGISSGFDYAVIAMEPTRHGVKAATQIAELLDHFGTPYDFAFNKIHPTDNIQGWSETLPKPHRFAFNFEAKYRDPRATTTKEDSRSFNEIFHQATKCSQNDRRKRSEEKVARYFSTVDTQPKFDSLNYPIFSEKM